MRIDRHLEAQVAGFGHVPEVAVHRVADRGEGNVFRFDRDRAGLDF